MNPRQANRVWKRGQLATIAVLDSIDEALTRGNPTHAQLGELEIALEAAEVVSNVGRRCAERPDAGERLEEALERLEVALTKWRDIIVAEIEAEDA